MNCGTCRFFLPLDAATQRGARADSGNCCRYPPVPICYPVQVAPTPANPQGNALANEGILPPVYGELHWCGEWTAKHQAS